MPEESPPAHVPDGRVSTGNPGLDAMLEGGLVAHRPYLLVGPAGTGKSRLALQFLCEGARRGERVLLVTIEEPPNEARMNHRGLAPELDSVFVFDAIPDIMRYERTPFKDIASVRSAIPFRTVPLDIRRTPELSSVEVTITALEQMLRSEVQHRGFTRLVIDSLTALQYFCMKGFDPVAGAQTFLRFLSDLQVTTLLTVESPLEDADTPERMLARGEVRLFRWELDDQTVRAIGVEKFRGSPHDVRLHPYRIGPKGLDINLRVTISRDTRKIIEPEAPALPAEPVPVSMEPMIELVGDLALVGEDLGALRTEVEAALAATTKGDLDGTELHLARARAHTVDFADRFRTRSGEEAPLPPAAADARRRILERADTVRVGVPPGRLPTPPTLAAELSRLLALIPPAAPSAPPPGPPTEPVPPPPPADLAAAPPVPPAPEPTPSVAPVVAPEPIQSPQRDVPVSPPQIDAPSGTPPEAEAPAPAAVESAPAEGPAAAAADSSPGATAGPETVPRPSPPSSPEPRRAPAREPVPSVAEFLVPHSHLHPEPPPLPGSLSTARPGSPSRGSGRGASPAPAASEAAASHSPTGIPAKGPPTGSASVPPLPSVSAPGAAVEPPPPAEAPAETGTAKRRRKPATTAKKRPSSTKPVIESKPAPPTPTIAPEASPELPPAPSSPSSDVSPPPAEVAGPAPEVDAAAGGVAPKPKRRAVRKKKAPPVVSATPGPVPTPPPAAPEDPAGAEVPSSGGGAAPETAPKEGG